MSDQEQVKDFLKKTMGSVDDRLTKDLWPRMRNRLEQRPATVPWLDWALAAAALVWLMYSPQLILALMYQL